MNLRTWDWKESPETYCLVLFYHRQLFCITFSQSITFQNKSRHFFYLGMLFLCFDSLMVRSLLISRLNFFMTSLFWFCSWPFVSGPALPFSLIFLPWTNIFICRLFLSFLNKVIHTGSFYLIVCPFLIIVMYFSASFPIHSCTQESGQGFVSALCSPISVFLISSGNVLIDVSYLWSYLLFLEVYRYCPMCLFLPFSVCCTSGL